MDVNKNDVIARAVSEEMKQSNLMIEIMIYKLGQFASG